MEILTSGYPQSGKQVVRHGFEPLGSHTICDTKSDTEIEKIQCFGRRKKKELERESHGLTPL